MKLPASLLRSLLVSAVSMVSVRAQEKIPGMVTIPAGSFEMGDHFGFVDPKHGSDEIPLHSVRLDSFLIGIHDVTTREFRGFLSDMLARKQIEVRKGGVYPTGGGDPLCDTRESSPSSPLGWDGKGFSVLDHKDEHPMVCVRWHGAAAYCNWLGARMNAPLCYNPSGWDCDFNKSGFRLPTEAEWEYAARGGKQNPYCNYPWGNDADPLKANVPESNNPFRVAAPPAAPPAGYHASAGRPGEAWRMGARPLTTPVGFFNGKLQHKSDFNWPGAQETWQTADGANGYGLYDMAGNVWQWCTEWYAKDYYAYSPQENPPGPAAGSPMPDGKTYRCIRGGSWFNGEFGHSRVSNRDPSYYRGPDPVTGLSDADGPWFHIGFRIVRPIRAEARPLTKPTPVQRVARTDSGTASGHPAKTGGPAAVSGNQGGNGPREGGGGKGTQLIPRNAAEQLDLTESQRAQIAALENEVATKLAAILTPEQQQKLAAARPPRRQGGNGQAPPEQAPPGPSSGADAPPPPPNDSGPGAPPAPPAPQAPQAPVRPQASGIPGNGQDTGVFTQKPLASFVLRSPAVKEGAELPKEFTGDGDGVSPPLEWAGAPAGTKSYAMILHHTDARGDAISYWVMYDMPASLQSLPKAAKGIGTLGISSRSQHAGYTPPHSAGPGTRVYVYTLYALSAPPPLAVAAGAAGHDALLAAIKDKILATADLSVHYTRYTVDDKKPDASAEPNPPPVRETANTTPAGSHTNPGAPHAAGAEDRRPARDDRPQDPTATGGKRRQAGGGGGGGGGRLVENNKTPVSPTPGQTVGLFVNTAKACPGYTLFAPKHNTTTYLINNQGRVVHQWQSEYEPGQSVYLKPNGNLLHTCQMRNRSFTGGGEGGRIEEYDWSGKMIWEFSYTTDQYQQHHDIAPLPNGNILMLVVEKKSQAECLAAGFPAQMLRDSVLYPDSVVEVQPVYPNSGKIVWQWKVWDHLIQDSDKEKANFGEVAAHPELIAVGGGRGAPAFWNHVNSIAYNPQLDQVVISARGNSELWVIDHTTTTRQAAGHNGGKQGKGGDLIYRWGNPAAYQRGSERDAQLNQQHDAEWIPNGYPGAGHFTIFNNGYNRGYTSIEEIVPPLDATGHYVINPGKPYGPEKTVWHYEAKNRTDFFSSEISGAHRLPNGNTLICAGVTGHLFEVTPAGEVAWQYVNPVVRGGILAQGEVPGKDVRGHLFNAIFKCHRYAPDYPGFQGRDLTPTNVIELPASQKGKTGMDKADASPNERPPGSGAKGADRPADGR